jgi:S1-C subfamily serine protease
MEDLHLLEAVERYINGSMNHEERVYFENLRKSNPEIDQAVVEHTLFLHQLTRFDQTRKVKSLLNDIHIDLSEKGAISSPKLQGREKVFYLYNRYKRTAAIAASIAGITALCISVLVSSVSPNKQATSKDIQYLNGKIIALANQTEQQDREINKVKADINTLAPVTTPKITYQTGGTGFLIDTKGYLVTNAHVIKGAKNIAVQNSNGKELMVKVLFQDASRDIAILKIEDEAFKAPSRLPYSIGRKSAEIAEPIYTLGFPRNDVVYGEGYLAAKTGYNGDTLTCQIAIAANPGNSGGPILNRNGEVIGVLSARQTTAEGVVFATQSKYIFNVLAQLQKADTATLRIKLPQTSSLKGLDRMQQVKKISDYIYMVKVN